MTLSRREAIPSAPPGRTGWPWTSDEAPARPSLPAGGRWPRISIVTPSFNQARYLEETIRSVLLQDYPDLEYIIIDGGSSDGSVEIIQRYERCLAYWISEPDRGQADALNKGLRHVTGRVFSWLNSDDYLLPRALHAVARYHGEQPDALLAAPVVDFVDGTSREWRVTPSNLAFRHLVEFWTDKAIWPIPGMFYPTAVLAETGALDETLRYVFDYDFLCRVLRARQPAYLPEPTVRFRLHGASKSLAEGHHFLLETARVTQRYWPFVPDVDVRGYARAVSAGLVRSGCARALRGHADGLSLVGRALRVHPAWAIWSALRELPRYLGRRVGGRRVGGRRVGGRRVGGDASGATRGARPQA